MTFKFIYSMLTIFGSLGIGYLAWRKGYVREETSRGLIKFCVLFFSPILLITSLWRLEISSGRLIGLPVIGALISTACIGPAIVLAKRHGLGRPQTGSIVSTAMFSNVGWSLGGFLCLVFLGEAGFSLSVLYAIYLAPYFYTIGFFLAEHYGSSSNVALRGALKRTLTNPVSLVPLASLVIGLGLCVSTVEAPPVTEVILKVAVPAATIINLFAIGLTVKFRMMQRHVRVAAYVSGIKYVYAPVIGLGLAYLLGYHHILDGLPLKVVFVEASMPVALSPLMLPSLFGLDQHVINASWLFSYVAFIAVMPILIFVVTGVM